MDFVLVTDRDQLRDLAGVWQGAWHAAGVAAAIAIVAPNPPDDRWARLTLFDAVKNTAPGKALGDKVKQIQVYVAANERRVLALA